MENLKLDNLENVRELTLKEASEMNGGGFWGDVFWVLGVAVHGLEVFATEGGRNAGICVK